MLRDGTSLADVLINETDTRMPEAQALIDGLAPLVASGIPVILTGDFNAASWRDWVGKPEPVEWPVSKAFDETGITDVDPADRPTILLSTI